VTTNFYSSGQVVFEVSSFFNRTVSKENFQAIVDCEGWYISYEQLNNLFHSMHDFRDFGRSILVKGFSSLKIRMLSMITRQLNNAMIPALKPIPKYFSRQR
jgi:hypothetical protein